MDNCDSCGSECINLWDEGITCGFPWKAFQCAECGEITSNEPDPDFLKGGKDHE